MQMASFQSSRRMAFILSAIHTTVGASTVLRHSSRLQQNSGLNFSIRKIVTHDQASREGENDEASPHRVHCVVGWFELCQPDGFPNFPTFEKFPQSSRTMRVIAAVMGPLGDDLC